METGDNGGELNIRSSAEIEIIVPVAQRKATRSRAQSEEEARKLRARAGGDHYVLTVPIKLKVDIWSRDRILSQRQAHVVLHCHAKQQFRSRRRLDCASRLR